MSSTSQHELGELRPERLWTGPHAPVVAGIFSLAFLMAFESLAVSTIMPTVADELDGLDMYALAFAMPIALGVMSMTIAGPLMDRRGPALGVRAGVGVFSMGLVVAGLAQTMPVFLIGRAVQGFGIGFVTVGLYVVIGQAFHESLRPRVFTVMTSAWLLPALIGPVLAGTTSELVGWRWVFLAVPVLAIASVGLIWRELGRIGGDPAVTFDRRRLWWASLVAAGVLVVSMSAQDDLRWSLCLLVVGLAVAVRYAPRLIPPGSWTWRRGLPAVVATRSLLSASYFGAETYVPLSLVEHRGVSTAEAGLLLTGAAVTWFSGSWMGANMPALASKPLRARLGIALVLVAVASSLLSLVDAVPVMVLAVLWAVGGLGMGLAAPTLSVLLLDRSAPGEQGINSAGMQTSDSVAQALMLAIGSVVFASMLDAHETAGYLLVLGLATASGLLAVVSARRIT